MTYTDVDEVLAHFGVKGMHWGVRKEESTSSEVSSKQTLKFEKRQFKAAPFHQKSADAKKQLDDLNANGLKSSLMTSVYGPKAADKTDFQFALRYGTSKKKAIGSAREELTKKKDWADKNADAIEHGKLTPGQKKAIIGASVIIGTIAAGAILTKIGANQIAKEKLLDSRSITSEFAGGHIPYEKFMESVGKSQKASWGSAEHIARVGSTNLNDLDLHLPKGTTFTRISSHPEVHVAKGNYASFLPEDVMRYRAAFVNEKGSGAKLYNVNIDTVKDIVSPSLKKRVDTFVDLLDTDIGGKVGGIEPAREVLARSVSSVKEQEFIRTAAAREVGEKYYHKVTGGSFRADKLSSAFADSILKKGYNAIVDDMDAGVYGDNPMVLLDTTAFKVAGSQPLTQSMIDEARQTLTEVIGRKF